MSFPNRSYLKGRQDIYPFKQAAAFRSSECPFTAHDLTFSQQARVPDARHCHGRVESTVRACSFLLTKFS